MIITLYSIIRLLIMYLKKYYFESVTSRIIQTKTLAVAGRQWPKVICQKALLMKNTTPISEIKIAKYHNHRLPVKMEIADIAMAI